MGVVRANGQPRKVPEAPVRRVDRICVGEEPQAMLGCCDRGPHRQRVISGGAGMIGEFASQSRIAPCSCVERTGELVVNQASAWLRQPSICRLPDHIMRKIESPFAARFEEAAPLQLVKPHDQLRFRQVHRGAEHFWLEITRGRRGENDQVLPGGVKAVNPVRNQRVKIAPERLTALSASVRQFGQKKRIAAALSERGDDIASVSVRPEKLRSLACAQRR